MSWQRDGRLMGRMSLFGLCFLLGCSSPTLELDEFEPMPDIEPPDTTVEPPRLVINEVMTRNQSTIMAPGLTGAQAFPDWVELYNADSREIDLSRVALRDGGGNLWPGMPGSLSPGEHLLLFADGTTEPGHLPFQLSSSGEELTLSVDDVDVDRLATRVMEPDTSWARFPDGGQWALTIRATPGWNDGIRPTDSMDPTDALFQRERISEFFITLPQASWDSLEASPYEQVPASLAFQGAFFRDVGMRIKGRYGSLRDLNGKAAFKLDLNDYEPGQGIRGLNHLTFNNMVQDPTYMHEYLAYRIFRAAGLPAPRVGWMRLYVNDEYFGLYLFIESVDDKFLERWYADPTGHLYEGAYGVDFRTGDVGSFEYDEGPDPDDRSALLEVATLLDGPATDEAIAELRTLVDLDQFIRYMAVEALTLHWDGYTTSNNYRVYHDPSTDLFQIIPWGTDQTFISYWFPPYQGNGRVYRFCLQNPGCRTEYGQALRDVSLLIDELDLLREVDELEGLLMDEIIADPRREASLVTVQAQLAATRDTLANWPEQVRGMIEP